MASTCYLRAFEALKQQGKTRFIGVTTHSNEPDVIRAAVESGVWDVVLTSYNFRQAHRTEVRAAIGEAAAAGVGVVVMKTQAGVCWNRTRVVRIDSGGKEPGRPALPREAAAQ